MVEKVILLTTDAKLWLVFDNVGMCVHISICVFFPTVSVPHFFCLLLKQVKYRNEKKTAIIYVLFQDIYFLSPALTLTDQ